MQELKALWDSLGTTGQAALCGALAGPVLSALQQIVTASKLKVPGLKLDSPTYAKRVASVLAACIPAWFANAETHSWQPVVAAGLVAWIAGQGTHVVRKRRAATKAKAAGGNE